MILRSEIVTSQAEEADDRAVASSRIDRSHRCVRATERRQVWGTRNLKDDPSHLPRTAGHHSVPCGGLERNSYARR
jgi:hypothetical protein